MSAGFWWSVERLRRMATRLAARLLATVGAAFMLHFYQHRPLTVFLEPARRV